MEGTGPRLRERLRQAAAAAPVVGTGREAEIHRHQAGGETDPAWLCKAARLARSLAEHWRRHFPQPSTVPTKHLGHLGGYPAGCGV